MLLCHATHDCAAWIDSTVVPVMRIRFLKWSKPKYKGKAYSNLCNMSQMTHASWMQMNI